jgi:membrane-associated protein
MDLLPTLFDFILHVDRYLAEFVAQYGPWVYALLFLIVFVETGLVVMPLCPAIRCSSSWGPWPAPA